MLLSSFPGVHVILYWGNLGIVPTRLTVSILSNGYSMLIVSLCRLSQDG